MANGTLMFQTSIAPALLAAITTVWLVATMLWLYSVKIKNVAIVDLWWAQFFVILSGVYMIFSPTLIEGRKVVVALLVVIWAFRLSGYLYVRNRNQEEDRRYQAIRHSFGAGFWWKSLWIVFLLQSTLAVIISAPLLIIFTSNTLHPFPTWTDWLGLSCWVIGFAFEAGGDYQLMKFRAGRKNPDQVCRKGLWAWTRHPNYFGDALLWWGFFLIACSIPAGYYTIFAPALMTFLLLRFSGVRLLESDLRERKPEYRAYIESVPAFFPRRPRNHAE